MFEINSYLQFRNTPDRKPRVLIEGKDYFEKHQFTLNENYYTEIAKLEDCRPLLISSITQNKHFNNEIRSLTVVQDKNEW